MGEGEHHFPCPADHNPDWQAYPVDAQSVESGDEQQLAFRAKILPVLRKTLSIEAGEGGSFGILCYFRLIGWKPTLAT